MEINFEVTKDDYIKFNVYHIKNSASQKKNFNLLKYIIPAIFSLLIYFIGTNLFKQPSIYWGIAAILFFIVGIIIYPKLYESSIKKQIEKSMSEGDNSEIFGKKKMIIDDETITIYNNSSFEKISKSVIKDIKTYDDIIALYTSSITAHIIPTRYLDEDLKNDLVKSFNLVTDKN